MRQISIKNKLFVSNFRQRCLRHYRPYANFIIAIYCKHKENLETDAPFHQKFLHALYVLQFYLFSSKARSLLVTSFSFVLQFLIINNNKFNELSTTHKILITFYYTNILQYIIQSGHLNFPSRRLFFFSLAFYEYILYTLMELWG